MNAPQTLIPLVLADQRDALIRAEVLAGEQREQLERAVIQAIRDCGVTVDAASDASGLRPIEIYDLLSDAPQSPELADLAGVR